MFFCQQPCKLRAEYAAIRKDRACLPRPLRFQPMFPAFFRASNQLLTFPQAGQVPCAGMVAVGLSSCCTSNTAVPSNDPDTDHTPAE